MRKLASIQKIAELNPIEGADRIEVATIKGWKCVVKKDEFNVGDFCIFFEIDSLIPRAPWNDFLADKNKPEAPVRLKTVRMRGQISQGLAIPLDILESIGVFNSVVGDERWDTVLNINDSDIAIPIVVDEDLTEALHIEKWEPPISASLSGEVRGNFPSVVPKTDEIRIQSEPSLLEELREVEVYWSIKMDGTSGTFANIEGDHHICSRNLSLKRTDGNTYWEMYDKYNLEKVLNEAGDYAIQGEVCGEGIQKNRAGLKGHHLFVFNVYDIREGRVLGLANMIAFCQNYGLTMVPLFKVEKFNYNTVDELVEIAKECKYENGSLGEGYVIRPTEPMYSKVLNGRMSFKVINPLYLVKNDC